MSKSKYIEELTEIYTQGISKLNTGLISKDRALPTAIIAGNVFEYDQIFIARIFGEATLWLFGVDRWFDERNEGIRDLADRCGQIVDGVFLDKFLDKNIQYNREANDLYDYLKKLVIQLEKKHESLINSRFVYHALHDVLFLGMMWERVNKGVKGQVALGEYLFYARESIGVKFVNWCVFASMGVELKREDYIYVCKINNLSAEIIRLANDTVTLEKELIEGNNNIFTFVQMNDPDKKEEVFQMISDRINELKKLIKMPPGYLQSFSDYVVKLVEQTVNYYKTSDFYDAEGDLRDKFIRE